MFAGRKDRRDKGGKKTKKHADESPPSSARGHFVDDESDERVVAPPSMTQHFEEDHQETKKMQKELQEAARQQETENEKRAALAEKKKKKKKRHQDVVRDEDAVFEAPLDETDDRLTTMELRDLEIVTPQDDSSPELLFRQKLQDDTFESYSALLGFARDLNTPLRFPEYVLVGLAGHGKSSLLDVIIGARANAVGSLTTTRPIFFQFINNLDSFKPRVVIKRDPASKSYTEDAEVTLDNLENALRDRMDNSLSTAPLYVTYEARNVFNATIIDTPGLGQTPETDDLVLSLVKPAHRHVYAVQTASSSATNDLLNFLRDIDPELTRTTLVYTGLFTALKTIQTGSALATFLARIPEGPKFFVSMPFLGVRDSLESTSKYREILFKLYHRDLQALEKLQFDKKLLSSLGVFPFREAFQNSTWTRFQNELPAISLSARKLRIDAEQQLEQIKKQVDDLTAAHKLRTLATNYVTEFLMGVSSLLTGTAEGNTLVNGQTSDEEKRLHGDSQWRNAHNYPLDIREGDLDIPFRDAKLYGGQQLERLFAEFISVGQFSEISEPSMGDVANAAGLNKLNKTPDIAWAASDLAQQKSREVLTPLVKQLGSRATFIIKRLAAISSTLIETRRQESQNGHLSSYRLFKHYVNEAFETFIDSVSAECEHKCLEEFYSTKTVHWYLSEDALPVAGKIDTSDANAVADAVHRASERIFDQLRQRILRNVVIKYYNFFLVPVQTSLWTFVQQKVSELTPEELNAKFEAVSTTSRLQEKERELLKQAEKYRDIGHSVSLSSTQYCNPV